MRFWAHISGFLAKARQWFEERTRAPQTDVKMEDQALRTGVAQVGALAI